MNLIILKTIFGWRNHIYQIISWWAYPGFHCECHITNLVLHCTWNPLECEWMHELLCESSSSLFTMSWLVSCIYYVDIPLKIFWWLQCLYNLSSVIGKWFVTFIMWGRWFYYSEHLWNCSNWFILVNYKLGIWCFNHPIWSLFCLRWLSCNLLFSLSTSNDNWFTSFDLNRSISRYLDFCRTVEALQPSLLVMSGPHLLDMTTEYD